MDAIAVPARPSATFAFSTPAATNATGSRSAMPPHTLRSGWPMPTALWSRDWPITQNSPATVPAQIARIRYGVTSGNAMPKKCHGANAVLKMAAHAAASTARRRSVCQAL